MCIEVKSTMCNVVTHVGRENEKEEHIKNICYQIKAGIYCNAN